MKGLIALILASTTLSCSSNYPDGLYADLKTKGQNSPGTGVQKTPLTVANCGILRGTIKSSRED